MAHLPPDDLVEGFLIWLAANRGRQPGTARQYRAHLAHLRRYMAPVDLLAATEDLLLFFTGPYLAKEGLQPQSRRAVVAAVRGFFAWATARHLLPANPAAALPYPKTPHLLPIPIPLYAAQQLLDAPDLGTLKGCRDAAMLGLLMGCGLRVGGLVALNESHLLATEHAGHPRLVVRVLEKGRKERLVPVPLEAGLLLRLYLSNPEMATIDRTLHRGDRVLFVSLRNRTIPACEYRGEARRLREAGVWRMMQTYAALLGIPLEQVSPHKLRHLYGTQMTEADVPTAVLQGLMGHADADSTAVYIRVATGKLFESTDRGNPLRRINTPVTDLLRRHPG